MDKTKRKKKAKPKSKNGASTFGLSPRSERVVELLFVKPTEGVMRRSAAGTPPQTSLRSMEQEIDRAGAVVTGQDVARLFAEMMSAIKNAPTKVGAASVPASKTGIESAVFGVFDRLDATLPLGTMVVMSSSVGFGQARWAETNVQTMLLAGAVTRARGERRAFRLKELAWHVLEYEYGPFLHLLLQVHRATHGAAYEEFTSIGKVLHAVKQLNFLGNDLWTDAARVRNAASHNGGWRFDLDNRVVKLRNRSGSGVWQHDFPLKELVARLDEVAGHAATIQAVVRRAIERDMVGALLPAFLLLAEKGDGTAVDAVLAPIHHQYQQTWTALQQLGWPSAV